MINFSEITHWGADFFDKGFWQGAIVAIISFVLGSLVSFVSWIKRSGYFVIRFFNH